MTATVEQENFYRYSTVIVDHVKFSFIKLLEYYIEKQGEAGITLRQFVLNNRHLIYHLYDTKYACRLCPKGSRFYSKGVSLRPLLYRSQIDILFDSSPTSTSSPSCKTFCCVKVKTGLKFEHLDLTFASVLLMECTNIVPHGSAERQAIESLRKIRNQSQGHVQKGWMSTEEYESSMESIERNVMVLAKVYGGEKDIKDMLNSVRCQPFNTELCKALQETMNKYQFHMDKIFEAVNKTLTDNESRKRRNSEESQDTEKSNTRLRNEQGSSFCSDSKKRKSSDDASYQSGPAKESEESSPEDTIGSGPQMLGHFVGALFDWATTGKGEFDRGNGKIVTWSYKYQLFIIGYEATCVDTDSGKSCTVMEGTREVAVEQAYKGLCRQLSIQNARLPNSFSR